MGDITLQQYRQELSDVLRPTLYRHWHVKGREMCPLVFEEVKVRACTCVCVYVYLWVCAVVFPHALPCPWRTRLRRLYGRSHMRVGMRPCR